MCPSHSHTVSRLRHAMSSPLSTLITRAFSSMRRSPVARAVAKNAFVDRYPAQAAAALAGTLSGRSSVRGGGAVNGTMVAMAVLGCMPPITIHGPFSDSATEAAASIFSEEMEETLQGHRARTGPPTASGAWVAGAVAAHASAASDSSPGRGKGQGLANETDTCRRASHSCSSRRSRSAVTCAGAIVCPVRDIPGHTHITPSARSMRCRGCQTRPVNASRGAAARQ